ncbi:MAG: hypothetical protein QXU32_06730 [Nitrososphaerales archaeon]
MVKTRRAPHPYHEPKVHDPDSICGKCGKDTVHVCEWCGICVDCHRGAKNGTERF